MRIPVFRCLVTVNAILYTPGGKQKEQGIMPRLPLWDSDVMLLVWERMVRRAFDFFLLGVLLFARDRALLLVLP